MRPALLSNADEDMILTGPNSHLQLLRRADDPIPRPVVMHADPDDNDRDKPVLVGTTVFEAVAFALLKREFPQPSPLPDDVHQRALAKATELSSELNLKSDLTLDFLLSALARKTGFVIEVSVYHPCPEQVHDPDYKDPPNSPSGKLGPFVPYGGAALREGIFSAVRMLYSPQTPRVLLERSKFQRWIDISETDCPHSISPALDSFINSKAGAYSNWPSTVWTPDSHYLFKHKFQTIAVALWSKSAVAAPLGEMPRDVIGVILSFCSMYWFQAEDRQEIPYVFVEATPQDMSYSPCLTCVGKSKCLISSTFPSLHHVREICEECLWTARRAQQLSSPPALPNQLSSIPSPSLTDLFQFARVQDDTMTQILKKGTVDSKTLSRSPANPFDIGGAEIPTHVLTVVKGLQDSLIFFGGFAVEVQIDKQEWTLGCLIFTYSGKKFAAGNTNALVATALDPSGVCDGLFSGRIGLHPGSTVRVVQPYKMTTATMFRTMTGDREKIAIWLQALRR